MKIGSLKSSADAAARWVKDIPGMGNIELLVRPTSNTDYRRRMQAMVRALPPSKRPKGVIDPPEMDRITGVCLCDHSLSGWKNVEDEGGKEIPYSAEQAKTFLTDPQYAGFRDGVLTAAVSVEEEEAAANEQTEKN